MKHRARSNGGPVAQRQQQRGPEARDSSRGPRHPLTGGAVETRMPGMRREHYPDQIKRGCSRSLGFDVMNS